MDYSAALYPCIAIAVFLCFAWSVVAVLGGLRLRDTFYWLSTGCIALTFGVSTFALIFPILNLSFGGKQPLATILNTELASGVLSLRISSCLIGLRGVVMSLHYLMAEETMWTARLMPKPSIRRASFDDIGEHMEDWTIDIVLLSQTGIFIVTTTSLWALVIQSKMSWQTTVLSWVLFLAVNDWAIIAAYLRILKGHIYHWHRIRIAIFDTLLILGVVLILGREFSWFVSIPVAALLLVLSFCLFAFAECAWNGKRKRRSNLKTESLI